MIVAAVVGCQQAVQPPAPAATAAPSGGPTAQAYGSLAEVMRGIPFPNSNIIFDAQTNDPGAAKKPADKSSTAAAGGATGVYSSVYSGWQAVEQSAIALQETANLVMIPGRKCENGLPVPLTDVEDCLPGVRAMLAAVDYRGIFNVEFKFDRRDGRFKIIELNPRSTWYAGHIARAGIDLPWMSYLDAQGLPVPAQASYQIGRYGLYEILDATAIVRAWSRFHRPQGRVVEPWLRGDRTLFWWRDPMPAVSGVSHIIGKRLGRLAGRGRRGSQPAI